MLGLFGFSIAALVFALYGATVLGYQNKKTKSSFNLNTYSNSFFLAVLACLSWAYATQQIASLVKPAVLIGDIFLLLATTLLLRTILVKNKNQYTFAAIALGAVAVFYRGVVDYRQPLMRDNVLVFYTPRLFGALLIVAVLTVWLRANMKFYEQYILPTVKMDVLRSSYFSANFVSIIGLMGFMFARKKETIIVSFTMIVIGYLTISLLNIAVLNQTKKVVSHGK